MQPGVLLPLVIAAALVGCGTTVPTGGTGVQSGPAADGLGVAAGAPGGLPAAGADGLGGAAPRSGIGGGSRVPEDPSGALAPAPSDSRTGRAGETARTGGQPGAAGGTIEIGFFLVKNLDVLLGALGAGGSSDSADNDAARYAQTMVAHINATGGYLGRPVKPVFAYLDAASSRTFDEQSQAACSTFFEDHQASAVVLLATVWQPLLECSNRERAPLLSYINQRLGRAILERGSYFAAPVWIDMERAAGPYVDIPAGLGFYGGWDTTAGRPGSAPVRVGLLRYDSPDDERFTAALERALRRRGLSLAAQFAFTPQKSVGDLSRVSSEAQSAVLQFKAARVTHVLSFDDSASMTVFFPRSAENQQYRPRYSLTSDALPAFIATLVPPEQLRGSIGIGWSPVQDVDAAHFPGWRGPTASTCLDVYRKAGYNTGDLATASTAMLFCEPMLFLGALLRTAGTADAGSVVRVLEPVGRSWSTAITHGVGFPGGRRDGVSRIGAIAYDESCSCFAYRGAPQSLD